MRLADSSDRIHAAGGEVIAVSVDSEERAAGMSARWPTPNVLYVSDPGGERILRPLDLFDPDERDGIALPAMVVFDPDGEEVFRYSGRDFADRTHDEDVFEALEGLGLDRIDPPEGGPDGGDPEQRGAFAPAWLVPYFKGNRFGALAIRSRAEGDEARRLADEHRRMCDAVLDAWSNVSG